MLGLRYCCIPLFYLFIFNISQDLNRSDIASTTCEQHVYILFLPALVSKLYNCYC